MSQTAVEKTLGKLITDECFRDRFFKDPAATSFYAGLQLSEAELDALSRLPRKALARFSTWLDDRICRLPLDEDQRPAPAGALDLEEDAVIGAARCARRRRAGSSTTPPGGPREGRPLHGSQDESQ